jgi:hypothetical protein
MFSAYGVCTVVLQYWHFAVVVKAMLAGDGDSPAVDVAAADVVVAGARVPLPSLLASATPPYMTHRISHASMSASFEPCLQREGGLQTQHHRDTATTPSPFASQFHVEIQDAASSMPPRDSFDSYEDGRGGGGRAVPDYIDKTNKL